MNKRVVITGLGLVTPIGIGVEQTWDSLCTGRSGVAEITRFDTSDYQTKIAAEVKDFKPEDFMPQKDAKRVELFIAYALAATRLAIDDSGLVINSSNESRRELWPHRRCRGICLVYAIQHDRNGYKQIA